MNIKNNCSIYDAESVISDFRASSSESQCNIVLFLHGSLFTRHFQEHNPACK